LTVDFYRVDIDNRITLSERIGGPEVTAFIEDQLGIPGVLGVRFFTNAIDTQTDGFDIVADYTFDLGGSSLALSAAYNKSDTEVSTWIRTRRPSMRSVSTMCCSAWRSGTRSRPPLRMTS
jgi:hypothetical protein